MREQFKYPDSQPNDILSFITTRFGGYVNEGGESFDFGYFTSENIPAVLKNYKFVENEHDIRTLVVLKQVHSNIIHEVTRKNVADVFLSDGDGLFTNETDIALGILTADCFPVQLVGKQGVAALHCGWRSLNTGIIERAITMFDYYDDFPEYAYVGPGICKNCYEVRQDMVNMLDSRYSPASALTKISDDRYKLDLKKVVTNALILNNISAIDATDETSCCSESYFSYRRDNGKTGRMLSVIMRRGKVYGN